MRRVFTEPAGTGLTWVVENQGREACATKVDHWKWTYPPAWRVMKYECNDTVRDIDGMPREGHTYRGRTKVCASVLEALDEAANPACEWEVSPLPKNEQLELVAFGDGESWVMVLMHPQYRKNGELSGWINEYHLNSYDCFHTELQCLGVPMPKNLEQLLEGEAMYDISDTKYLEPIIDWDKVRTRKASEKHALDVLNTRYFESQVGGQN